MKMTTIRQSENSDRLETVVVRNCWVPVNLPKPRFRPLGKEETRDLFVAYFNNKMTIILLMLQRRMPGTGALAALKAQIFLDDLYHHMLRSEYQQHYGRVFQWLGIFFMRFPNVKPVQKRKAIAYLGLVFRMFGLKLDPNI
jgi:hypothetical protein